MGTNVVPLPSVESGERGPLLAPFMGWRKHTAPLERGWFDGAGVFRLLLPPWDRDNAAAHEVIEAMAADCWSFSMTRGQNGNTGCSFYKFVPATPTSKHRHLRGPSMFSKSFPDAVTAAALLALGVCVVPGREGA